MQNVPKLLVVLLILVTQACNQRHLQFAKVPVCIIGDAGLICHDPNANRDYTIPIARSKNYICSDPQSYQKVQTGVLNLAKKYEQCLTQNKMIEEYTCKDVDCLDLQGL